MNGNITPEGIQADLKWMRRIGLGGLQNFDGATDTPQLVPQRLPYMTSRWDDAFRGAVKLSSVLGLEFAIAGSPGWSESGGPWVRPDQGMKKLVWTETTLRGGVRFAGTVARPPATVGPFQNSPVDRSFGLLGGPPAEPVPDFYQDVAVVAYRLSANDVSSADLRPAVTTSAGDIDAPLLWDGDYSKAVTLPVEEPGHPSWIRFDFGHPQCVQSLSLARQGTIEEFFNDPAHVVGELQSSDDGLAYRTIAAVREAFDLQQTITFPAATARYFLTKPTSNGKPEFDEEMPDENQAMIEALKRDRHFVIVTEWRSKVDVSRGAPVIEKESVRRE